MTQQILIVDDSKMARMYVHRCLEMSGLEEAEFLEAENGKIALSIMEEQEIHIVVSDVNMPEMDGKTMLKWMRSNEKLREIPVIFITSVNNMAKIKELVMLGARSVLSKPVSPSSLIPVIEKLMGKGEK